MKLSLPAELEVVRERARRAISPIKPVDADTRAENDFLFKAKRTEAGRSLPDYYLVYFLFVELLGFQNLGKFEKISWSIPIDYQGEAFLIEHRKFGVGVFAKDLENEERAAHEIVIRIQKAVKEARPFYDWLAKQAVQDSKINVVNNSDVLYQRFIFFLDSFKAKSEEANLRKDERVVESGKSADGTAWTQYSMPAFALRKEAGWIALAAIEAFFAWTEHVFIHLAILQGAVKSAGEVSDLAAEDWPEKFKAALDISIPSTKKFFDTLIAIRRGLRNHVSHGAFGKDGEAFHFHSGAGAVPVLLPHQRGSRNFALGAGLAFNEDAAIKVITDFSELLWEGPRAPAKAYIQESGLPIILTSAADGTYSKAMSSMEAMEAHIEHLSYLWDQAANMDW